MSGDIAESSGQALERYILAQLQALELSVPVDDVRRALLSTLVLAVKLSLADPT
jgi:hypothetical protein